MGKTLFIENARKLRYEAGWVAVHRDGDPRPVLLRADELDCIVVDGKAAFISTYLLDELAARGCSVILTDSRHMPASVLMPLAAATIDTNGKVLTQMSWGAWPRKMLWKKIVECKLDNQASVLEGSGHEKEAGLLASYAGEVRADDSTGREAAGARRYFQALFGTGFVRAPHADATNNALDYGYSVLLSHTACRIAAKGYLNQVGIHHHSKTNPYNLACDLMEPFRPLIDRKVELEHPCELTPSVKRLLASTLADRVPYGHGSYRVSDAIDLWVDGCLRMMEGTGDADGISTPGMPLWGAGEDKVHEDNRHV